MADWFWVRSVLYFAGELQRRHRFEWLMSYLDLVIELDPDFVEIYRWGGTALILRTNKVTLEDVRLANQILEQGATRFPDDWGLAHMAAANCSYYISKPSPQEKLELDACRRKFLQLAADRPSAPFYISLSLAALDEGDEEKYCALLIDSYLRTSSDPVLREQVERRMKSGMCTKTVDPSILRSYQKRFDAAWNAAYPYLEPDLFVHVHEIEPGPEQEESLNESR